METRWDRLERDLKAAGFEVTVFAQRYQDNTRTGGGVSRSITYRVPGKGTVEVGDQWWSKNLDVWIGWEVSAVDPDGILLTGRPRASKKRSETVAAFQAALAKLTA